MLSAKGRDAEVSKGLSMGADIYVTKPFSTRELMAEIRELLGTARRRRPRVRANVGHLREEEMDVARNIHGAVSST